MTELTANAYTTANLAFIEAGDTVLQAHALMTKRQVRHLPVVDNGEAIGVISDRDLQFVQDLAQDKALLCRDIMSEAPYTVSTETSIKEMAQEMTERKISSAIIRNSEGKICGIFTTTDALKFIAHHA